MTTKAAAHALLDRVRNGEDIPAAEISEALRTTGDLPTDEPSRIVTPAGKWEGRRSISWPPPYWFTPIQRLKN